MTLAVSLPAAAGAEQAESSAVQVEGGAPVVEDPAESNEACLLCHREEAMRSGRDARPVPFVDEALLGSSPHSELACVQCHVDATDTPHPPHLEPARCSECHEGAAAEHAESIHGRGLSRGDQDVPRCQDCHGAHDLFRSSDPRSKVYPLRLPETCGTCHADQRLVEKHTITVRDPYQRYVQSAHGRGLLDSGLLVSAACNDCHGSHLILPREDPRSKVNRANVAATCGSCHAGVEEVFAGSVHGKALVEGNAEAPTCSSCHSSHGVTRVVDEAWRLGMVTECAGCHQELLDTYRETYHGQVTSLGFTRAARCSDCHGSHAILPPEDRSSTLSERNIVATCQKCHPGATASFALYQPHADHSDRERFPVLFYVYYAMTALLIAVFSFFGLHTALWLVRALAERRGRKQAGEAAGADDACSGKRAYVRFGAYERFLHVLVVVSFLGLALTGLPLKFAYTPWAQSLMRHLGGVEVAGGLHRFFAIVTFVYFALHLGKLLKLALRKTPGMLWGPNSLVPQPRDLADMIGHFRWFLGMGPRPRFDRWTYWEKFDYWAVFWGVAVIGLSGLVLWFPTGAARLMPGWMFNVAMVVHSDEALLAAGFIFAVHFFNSHFRPEKFPMDPVIFTGRISMEELQEERPDEYARLVETGGLEQRLAEPVHPAERRLARAFGLTALAIGLLLLVLMIASVVFAFVD